jgi:hypothetical protein
VIRVYHLVILKSVIGCVLYIVVFLCGIGCVVINIYYYLVTLESMVQCVLLIVVLMYSVELEYNI